MEGDRQILAAALATILQNAVKFTRARGRVALDAYAVADRVLIGVEDECGGVPEGKAEELFRPFEQLSVERTGLGLGLPISRRGVEANGGQLYARNLQAFLAVLVKEGQLRIDTSDEIVKAALLTLDGAVVNPALAPEPAPAPATS